MFDAHGRVLGAGQLDFEQHFPQPGWVEHDANEIFATQWQAAQQAHAAAGAPQIDGVGITNQRETVVVFDRRTGVPVHRAIVWQDRRTAEQLRALSEAGHAERVRAKTGLPLDPYFSAAKIAWILDHVPGARAAAARGELVAGTIDTWLLHRLTDGEVVATEASNAARTSLFDLARGDYDDELLELFGVPRACLPEVRDSAGAFGRVAATGWPITGVLGDQQAALFGQGCVGLGGAKCTYGTGAFMLRTCGEQPPAAAHGLLSTVAWRLDGTDTFALEGSVMVCGALIQWLRDGLGMIAESSEVEALARSVDDSGGVVMVPAFAGLGTPHWDADARALLIGMTRGTGRGHVARAALEAMALQVRELQLAMEATTGTPLAELRVDGGAAANDLLLEMQATLSGVGVRRAAQLETTALGAARIAMLGARLAASADALPPVAGEATVIAPGGGLRDPAGTWRRWGAAVERAKGWARV